MSVGAFLLIIGLAILALLTTVLIIVTRRAPVVKLERGNLHGLTGVNVGGWLNLEDWFFQLPDAVQDVSGGNQGQCLMPGEGLDTWHTWNATATSPGWSSEGDVTTRLYGHYGAAKTVSLLQSHRDTYVTEADFRSIAEHGLTRVRFPVGWWTFSPVDTQADGLIRDPWTDGTSYLVPVRADLLAQALTWCHRYGLQALIDIHNLPGGSSIGSYNGVAPLKPTFWTRVAALADPAQDLGYQVHDRLFAWYKALPTHLKRTVYGIQLLNEPAHLMPQARTTMLNWLTGAIQRFQAAFPHAATRPRLFVNLIATAFPTIDDFWTACMTRMAQWAEGFQADRLYLDVHNYFAWNDPPYNTTAPDLSDVPTALRAFRARMEATNPEARFLLACSEFSLAFNHVSSACNPNQQWRAWMLQQQVQHLLPSMELYFWTWNAPFAYTHRNWWSLKDNLAVAEHVPAVPGVTNAVP